MCTFAPIKGCIFRWDLTQAPAREAYSDKFFQEFFLLLGSSSIYDQNPFSFLQIISLELGLRWFSGSFRQNQTTIGKFPTCLWQNQNFQATVGRFRHLPKFSNQCSSVRQFLAYILVYRESTRRRTVWKTSILV